MKGLFYTNCEIVWEKADQKKKKGKTLHLESQIMIWRTRDLTDGSDLLLRRPKQYKLHLILMPHIPGTEVPGFYKKT